MESSTPKDDGALQKARLEAENRWAYWVNCQTNKVPASLGNGKTHLSKYLELDTWTPEQAACLVSGIEPESIEYLVPGISDIANIRAYSLSGMQLFGGSALIVENGQGIGGEAILAFDKKRRVLELWNSRENPPAKVTPRDFVVWCATKNIDTSWLAEIESDTFQPQAKAPQGEINQSGQAEQQPESISPHEYTTNITNLFDSLNKDGIASIFKIPEFDWSKAIERAARNGLISARTSRGKYNPAKVASWLILRGLISQEGANRTLARNLPTRSKGNEYLITGEKLDFG